MTINLNVKDLHLLGLQLEKLEVLHEDEQKAVIRQAWKSLVLKHHPDKGGKPEKFREINEAYAHLIMGHDQREQKNDTPNYDISQYFTKFELNVPTDAFDILMQDEIAEVFECLRKEFSTLKNIEQKKRFATHYASFLILAEELEHRAGELMRIRVNALENLHHKETLGAFILRQWKEIVIRLFAEEYLDDFQYRDALAGNNVRAILAPRKLASPIKWLALITASLNLLLYGTGDYMMRHGYGFASLVFILSSPISAINFFVELMASPVNRLIKPLAHTTRIPPLVYTILLACISAGLSYFFQADLLTLSLVFVQSVLPIAGIALNIYSIYVAYQSVKILYDKGVEDIALCHAKKFAFVIVMNFIPSTCPIVNFLFTVGTFCLIHSYRQMMVERPIEHLPLPAQPIPEELKQATLLGYTKAKQSHRFFATPKDADFDNQRTFWQKTTSFFGVDCVTKTSKPQIDEASTLVLA